MIRNSLTVLISANLLQQDSKSKLWFEVGDDMAREKVGQQLRDCLKARSVGQSTTRKLKKPRPTTSLNKAQSVPCPEVTRSAVPYSDMIMVDTKNQSSDDDEAFLIPPTMIAVSSEQFAKVGRQLCDYSSPSISYQTKHAESSKLNASASVVTKSTHASDETLACNESFCNDTLCSEEDEPFLVPPTMIAVTSEQFAKAGPQVGEGLGTNLDGEESCTSSKTLKPSSWKTKSFLDDDTEPSIIPPSLISASSAQFAQAMLQLGDFNFTSLVNQVTCDDVHNSSSSSVGSTLSSDETEPLSMERSGMDDTDIDPASLMPPSLVAVPSDQYIEFLEI